MRSKHEPIAGPRRTLFKRSRGASRMGRGNVPGAYLANELGRPDRHKDHAVELKPGIGLCFDGQAQGTAPHYGHIRDPTTVPAQNASQNTISAIGQGTLQITPRRLLPALGQSPAGMLRVRLEPGSLIGGAVLNQGLGQG